ncbi:MAG TPA: prolyl oligopeptidase family serine peptidase [Pyrinomonadaceae bacterium]|nr:prolyl oligopeptidase family serine peptidase [Pyrinomonadaceae bacterium]HMP66688.1 prolyl oligopeptidase family serine peptidase [Pyrinomonadaceae bacterium]
MRNKTLFFVIVLTLASGVFAQGSYRQPPKEVLDVLHAPAPPATSISPTRDRIALLETQRYPPIAELAEPMLRIAGLRINPVTNAQHRQNYFVGVRLQNIGDGRTVNVDLPAGARIVSPQWSPDGRYIAAGNLTPNGVELWFIETATGRATRVPNVFVNTAFGGFSWESPTTVSARLVPANRGPAPQYRDIVPSEPNIQETAGRSGAIQTFQDLLSSPNDERLFDHYASSQPAMIDVKGTVRNIGPVGIYDNFSPSPDGRYILTSRIQRPYSYLFPANRFPRNVEVWDSAGKPVYKVADIPLQDALPIQGVPVGRRSQGWIPTEGATLIWVEALDGGDPRKQAEHRDKLMKLAAPFTAEPTEMLKIQHRYQGRAFGERDGMMLFFDFERDRQHRRIFMTDHRSPKDVKLISDLNVDDRYNAIGNPITKTLPNGNSVIVQNGDEIFMTGPGSSPEGDRPFFRAMNLKTLETREIFRSGTDEYEAFVAMMDDVGMNFITRKESVTEPPNLFMRQVCPPGQICTALAYRQLTEFADPSPQLRGITKQLVQYKRDDGVDLSFTLYLPPGYKEGTRLPTVLWAYPLSFTDGDLAGQVTGSTNRFTQMGGSSHLFFLLQGYAVLDNATMPIVGTPETKNDTFVKQIVASAKAAIDKGVEMGVVDPERVGVGGHSYGAFMTANLMAHSNLFRAGIARSGAYNRTLTPFGFQDERRSFWEATRIYTEVSPFFYANRIKDPILIIHGEADNNTGTYPIQSERLFAAIRGNGGTARLVMLPHESHGYVARESVEHTLYEQMAWFDRHVKNAKPRPSGSGSR